MADNRHQKRGSMSVPGPDSDIVTKQADVRSTPKSEHPVTSAERPFLPNRKSILTHDDQDFRTDVVKELGETGAECHTDPFVSNAKHTERSNFMSRLAGWLESPGDSPTTLQPPQTASRKAALKIVVGQTDR
jgi:hypothetical protein